jgi:hypothetical protein
MPLHKKKSLKFFYEGILVFILCKQKINILICPPYVSSEKYYITFKTKLFSFVYER